MHVNEPETAHGGTGCLRPLIRDTETIYFALVIQKQIVIWFSVGQTLVSPIAPCWSCNALHWSQEEQQLEETASFLSNNIWLFFSNDG